MVGAAAIYALNFRPSRGRVGPILLGRPRPRLVVGGEVGLLLENNLG